MTTPLKYKLLHALSGHLGRGRGVSVEDLSARVAVPVRQVRRGISALRQDGVAICGKPRHGYYIANSPEELEETCQFLRSRAMHSLVLEARLRKLPLPALLGQLQLT